MDDGSLCKTCLYLKHKQCMLQRMVLVGVFRREREADSLTYCDRRVSDRRIWIEKGFKLCKSYLSEEKQAKI